MRNLVQRQTEKRMASEPSDHVEYSLFVSVMGQSNSRRSRPSLRAGPIGQRTPPSSKCTLYHHPLYTLFAARRGGKKITKRRQTSPLSFFHLLSSGTCSSFSLVYCYSLLSRFGQKMERAPRCVTPNKTIEEDKKEQVDSSVVNVIRTKQYDLSATTTIITNRIHERE